MSFLRIHVCLHVCVSVCINTTCKPITEIWPFIYTLRHYGVPHRSKFCNIDALRHYEVPHRSKFCNTDTLRHYEVPHCSKFCSTDTLCHYGVPHRSYVLQHWHTTPLWSTSLYLNFSTLTHYAIMEYLIVVKIYNMDNYAIMEYLIVVNFTTWWA